MTEQLELFRQRDEWHRVGKFDRRVVHLVDGIDHRCRERRPHYSRRKPGTPQCAPPGETVVLWHPSGAAFIWWRPHPSSGFQAMNGKDGWTCSLFRREGGPPASKLILTAERALVEADVAAPCGPDGLMSYVSRLLSGKCFLYAGYRKIGESADGKKDLWQKPWAFAGRRRHNAQSART